MQSRAATRFQTNLHVRQSLSDVLIRDERLSIDSSFHGEGHGVIHQSFYQSYHCKTDENPFSPGPGVENSRSISRGSQEVGAAEVNILIIYLTHRRLLECAV